MDEIHLDLYAGLGRSEVVIALIDPRFDAERERLEDVRGLRDDRVRPAAATVYLR